MGKCLELMEVYKNSIGMSMVGYSRTPEFNCDTSLSLSWELPYQGWGTRSKMSWHTVQVSNTGFLRSLNEFCILVWVYFYNGGWEEGGFKIKNVEKYNIPIIYKVFGTAEFIFGVNLPLRWKLWYKEWGKVKNVLKYNMSIKYSMFKFAQFGFYITFTLCLITLVLDRERSSNWK